MRTIIGAVIVAVMVGCSRGPAPMRFCVLSFPDAVLTSGLTAASKDGWEVQSTRRTVTNGVAAYEVICKRPASMGPESPNVTKVFTSIREARIEVARWQREKDAADVAAAAKEAAAEAARAASLELQEQQRQALQEQSRTAATRAEVERGVAGKINLH